HGRAFIAIRENELAARAMGINLAHYKTVAFAVGAFYAGISGGLFAGLSQFVNPDAFVFPVSILYVTMGILGGIGSLAGAAFGGAMLTLLPELLRSAAEYKDFLTGLLLLVLLIFLPKGLVGALQKRLGALPSVRAEANPSGVPLEQPGTLRSQVNRADLAANLPYERPRVAESSDPLLKVEGIGISFGGLRALHDINLELGANEILGIIGPNGAGKTT